MRNLALLAIAGLAFAAGQAAAQESYPSKPIRFILPYAAGGSADALARALAEELREHLGQPVIVESRPGANSIIGAEVVARAPADGYTLLYLGTPTISTNLVMFKSIPYRLENFQPITTFFRSPVGISVKKDLPVSNLKELIGYAKHSGGLTYGTSGTGSSPHLLMERLSKITGAQFIHVPYKGEGPAVADVVGGHLPMFVGSLATPGPQHRAGKLKLIVTSAAERIPAFPDVATFRDEGFEQYVFTFWHGVAAPAGIPRPIVDKLHRAFVAAIDSRKVRNVFSQDWIPTTMSPEAFTELIKRDIATWGPVIRESGLVVE